MTPTDTQFESVRVMQTTISEECRLLEAASPLLSFHFHSILFERAEDETSEESTEPPEFFYDLNLDQIVDAITAGRSEYNLKPFFYKRPRNLTCILYRQQIMRDLEKQSIHASIKSFSNQMRSVRLHLNASEKIHYEYGRKAWFLDAVELYCEAVLELGRSLNRDEPSARGLRAFQEYLTQYTESEGFKALVQETKAVKSKLSAIRYCLLIRNGSLTVLNSDSETDYSTVIEEIFSRFKQGTVKDYRVQFSPVSSMNHVEAAVLERVAWLNPDAFRALDVFCASHRDFLDQKIVTFDRQIQFYIAYLEYIERFKNVGLKFCYPRLSSLRKNMANRDGFDLALADKLIREKADIVCNDFTLKGCERIFVVTGPNQGGKTTFARVFGQIHYIASLGCPVPGSEARLFLFDRLFTHFEREEEITTLRGKLKEDLIRIHRILAEATSNSIIIINEMFSSTSMKDAVFLTRRILETISRLDLFCVCVTFLDELSSLNEKTVSIVATVLPDNPTVRTYKLERRTADGLAYALSIAEKYRLTYKQLKERIQQ